MFRWFIITIVVLMLGGCLIPATYSSYYLPIYPDLDRLANPWLASYGKGSAPKSTLRFKFSNGCFMQLSAFSSDSDFILSWGLERYGKSDDVCNYVIGKEDISIQTVKTGQYLGPKSVHRIFNLVSKPKMNFKFGMQAYSSYFSEIPPEQQTYTVAIPLRLKVDKNIPKSISIKLPDINIGEQQFAIPLLHLKKVETGGNIKAYVPDNPYPMTGIESITSYGRGINHHRTTGTLAIFIAGVTMWHEEKGELRFASSFSGRDDVETSEIISPEISGEIFIKIMSGKGITFTDSRVIWLTEEGNEIVQQIDTKQISLVAYRTSLADVTRFPNTDDGPHFIIPLPNFHPERVSVTLPSLETNGNKWPLKSIDFEYKSSGVGFATWP